MEASLCNFAVSQHIPRQMRLRLPRPLSPPQCGLYVRRRGLASHATIVFYHNQSLRANGPCGTVCPAGPPGLSQPGSAKWHCNIRGGRENLTTVFPAWRFSRMFLCQSLLIGRGDWPCRSVECAENLHAMSASLDICTSCHRAPPPPPENEITVRMKSNCECFDFGLQISDLGKRPSGLGLSLQSETNKNN